MDTGTVVGWFGLSSANTASKVLRALRRAGYRTDFPSSARYECLFVDTQDGRLAKSGCRLSIRWMGKDAIWYLTGPEGESVSPFEGKVSFACLSPGADGIPPLIQERAGGRLLLPFVRLRLYTWDARLQDPSGNTLALRAERFRAALPREAWPRKRGLQGLLSVRPLAGNPDAFLHLTTYLRDRLNLPVSPDDTYQLALRTLGIPEPGAPVPAHLRLRLEDPLVMAGRKVVAQQTLRIQANLHGALEDVEPEYLHDLRVATRRLRSALRLFAGVLGPRRSESLRLELRWIGRLLGDVRDLDVFILNLQTQAQRLGESGAIVELLVAELRRQRLPARQILEAALVSRRFSSLVRRLETLGASPPPRRPRGDGGLQVAQAAPALIRKAWKRVLALGRAIGPDSPATDLHRLRILFKRLRYACEFFREAFVDPASGEDPLGDEIQAMVRFQDCLGEHQDAVVAITRIQDLAQGMVQSSTLTPQQQLDLGGLIQVQREIVRERRDRFVRLWARFDKRSARKRLAALEGRMPSEPSREEAPQTVPG